MLTTHRLAYRGCQCDATLDIKLALGLVVARNERWRYPMKASLWGLFGLIFRNYSVFRELKFSGLIFSFLLGCFKKCLLKSFTCFSNLNFYHETCYETKYMSKYTNSHFFGINSFQTWPIMNWSQTVMPSKRLVCSIMVL